MPNHDDTARILWTGNRDDGVAQYKAYDQTLGHAAPGKAPKHCSNDPEPQRPRQRRRPA